MIMDDGRQISRQGVCVRVRFASPARRAREVIPAIVRSHFVHNFSPRRSPMNHEQRGLSGIPTPEELTTRPSMAPIPNASRQPSQTGSQRGRAGRWWRRSQGPRQSNRNVDEQGDSSADARRNQLVDRRVDGRVFPANAGASQRAKKCVARKAPGESRQRGRDQMTATVIKKSFFRPSRSVP